MEMAFPDVSKAAHTDKHPSQELLQEISDAFEFFDLDGDGKLSLAELGTVVGELGDAVTEDELRGLIKRVDSDGDGQLDLCEFIDLNMIKGEEQPAVDAVVAAFDRFDADKDGFISAEELHRVLAGFGEEKFSLEECRCMIKSVDENGDRVMSLAEFQALMSDNRGFGLVGAP